MKKLRVLIADDEADAIEVLKGILMDSGKVAEVHAVQESHKVECSLQKLEPDVLFLDIEMPGLNGLTILDNIREYNQDLPVVYVTAYRKYIPDAIKLNVYSYLVKPIDREELTHLLRKLLDHKQKAAPSPSRGKIKLPVKDGYVFMDSDEVFMLEADGNYTRIITVDQNKYISSYNMGRLAQRFPEGELLRINRSTCLNGAYLVQINRKALNCTARVKDQEFTFEISRSFLKHINKERA